jgi:LSD1 subclass zinc finger protein
MLESLNCNSCGAPIDVPSSAKFVKCNHCKANLQVRRSGGGIFTEAVEQLTETTEDLAQQVAKLTEQNELAELDRRWQTERQSYMIQSKNGHHHLPTEGHAWAGGIGVVVFGGLWTIFAFSLTQSGPNFGAFAAAKFIFPLFGLGFIAFGVFSAMSAHHKAQVYRKSLQHYQRQRNELSKKD